MKERMPSVVVVVGPTASGKSRLGLEIAQRFDGEIVNADSVQVYKGFNIGSAKPSVEEQQRVPHYLVSTVDPTERFDAGKFVNEADSAIAKVSAKNKVPVVVGGTGLYIQSLLCGISEISETSEKARVILRVREGELIKNGKGVALGLHSWLCEIDPKTAALLHPNDIARIRRAIEVKLTTGQSIAELHEQQPKKLRYRALVIALLPERELLYKRIDERVEEMLKNGLVEEVVALLRSWPREVKPFESIGYSHVIRYLDGFINKSELAEEIKRDTRRYAKRQYTWWNNQPKKLQWDIVAANDIAMSIPCEVVKAFVSNESEFLRDSIYFWVAN